MAMKVILNQDVVNLGEEGDVCTVADGFGRNYLVPQGLAVPYTNKNVILFEQKKEQIEKRKEEKRQQALSIKEKILALGSIDIKMQAGEGDKLFGAVTSAMIADQLQAAGIEVERKKIDMMGHVIKMLGSYDIRIKLYNNEAADITVVVSKEEEKA